jgi:hypothetical protein
LVFDIKLFVPQTILQKTAIDYTNENALKWTVSKISDEYLPPDFKKPKNEIDVYRGQSSIRVPQTPTEKISNVASLVGILALALDIILLRDKTKYE